MAEKKKTPKVIARSETTKQSRQAKKADKSVTNSIVDLRKLSVEELQKLLQTARADLIEMQKSLKANELANPRTVRKQRREIARILTVISEVSKSNDETPLDNSVSNGVKENK